MLLFDTHAHLDDDRFRDDLSAVLNRAAAAGLTHVNCIATTAADSVHCVEIAGRFPLVWASVGIQPNNITEAQAGDWAEIERLATAPRVVAIGETGLDRYWDRVPFALQQDYFHHHLVLAHRHGLPVIIHCREAEADVVRMLRSHCDYYGPVRGVMHSFTGDQATADACLAMGLYVSFAGMVTYKTAGDLRAVAKTIPADRLLVETDCPYLAPVPMRGKRNEPAYVAHTAALLAQERGEEVEQLAARTTENALTLFNLK